MRISDWSSDVCSSDLVQRRGLSADHELQRLWAVDPRLSGDDAREGAVRGAVSESWVANGHFRTSINSSLRGAWGGGPCGAWWRGNGVTCVSSPPPAFGWRSEERRVGKRVSVRVDLGGRR